MPLSDWASLKAQSLLPINAAPLEIALSVSYSKALNFAVEDYIVGIKQNPPDAWLDALIYEYGLQDLSPYFDDKRKLIREGVAFNRIRGTPKALAVALRWGNFEALALESLPSVEYRAALEKQTYRPFEHFAEFDLSFETPIVSPDKIESIQELSYIAKPLRSRLWRVIYRLNDPVFKLSHHRLSQSALLSDDSGCWQALGDEKTQKISQKIKRQTLWDSRHDLPYERYTRGAFQSALVRISAVAYSREAVRWVLDDKTQLFDCFSGQWLDSGVGSLARYQGQMWASVDWGAQTWQSALVLCFGASIKEMD